MKNRFGVSKYLIVFMTLQIISTSCALLITEEMVISSAARSVVGRAAVTRLSTRAAASRVASSRLGKYGLRSSGAAVEVNNPSLFYSSIRNLRLVGKNLYHGTEFIGVATATGLVVDDETIPLTNLGFVYKARINNVPVYALPYSGFRPLLTYISAGQLVYSTGEDDYDEMIAVDIYVRQKTVLGAYTLQKGYIESSNLISLSDLFGLGQKVRENSLNYGDF